MRSRPRLLRTVLRGPIATSTWRCAGYWLAVLALTVPGFVLVVLAAVSSVLTVAVVGVVPMLVALLLARPLGRALRAVARIVLHAVVAEPPMRPVGGTSLGSAARSVLTDPAGWRVLAYVTLALPLAAVTVYATALLLVGGVLLISCPAWWWLSDDGFGLLDVGPWPSSWFVVPAGVVAVLLAPWVPRLATAAGVPLVRALLGPTREQARVTVLDATRTAELDAAAATLRRLERDLHDATQARFVALGITLTRLRDRLGSNAPSAAQLDEARRLAEDGSTGVTDGLAELRRIIAGVRPPSLDAGLSVALATLCASSPVPAALRTNGPAVHHAATSARIYFCVAELLANVARHARASSAVVEYDSGATRLTVRVSDDGCGGVDEAAGTGLRGLRERLAAIDGTLAWSSPVGGPTVTTIEVPQPVR